MVKVMKFFDKLEDRVRERLSTMPILYAVIGGLSVVLFWRGVWHLADGFETLGGWQAVVFSPAGSLLISVLLLLVTGLFVSFFIGDRIILSGLRHEKKVEEKTESEVREEEAMITALNRKIDALARNVEDLKMTIKK